MSGTLDSETALNLQLVGEVKILFGGTAAKDLVLYVSLNYVQGTRLCAMSTVKCLINFNQIQSTEKRQTKTTYTMTGLIWTET